MIADFLLFVHLSLESIPTTTTPIPIPNPERPIHHDHTALRHDDELNALLRWFSFVIHHQGGGILVFGAVTMTECTISDNTAVSSPSPTRSLNIYIDHCCRGPLLMLTFSFSFICRWNPPLPKPHRFPSRTLNDPFITTTPRHDDDDDDDDDDAWHGCCLA